MAIREPLVRDFMTLQPMTIESRKSVQDARNLMSRFGIRHLPVMEDGIVMGVLSERELNLAMGIESIDSSQVLVIDVCVEKPFIVDPETPVREVAGVMANRHYGSAIVMKNGKLVGIFTTVDACRALHNMIEDIHLLMHAQVIRDFRFAAPVAAL